MDRVENPQIIRQALNNLQAGYQDDSRRDCIHLTDLIYCLTRSWFDKRYPLPPTDEEVLLFALGWGLQKVLVPEDQEAEEIICDGIHLSPDFMSIGGVLAELKTTRQSSRRKNESKQYEPSPFSESWVEQMKGYCYAQKLVDYGPGSRMLELGSSYDLLVLHMMGNYAPPFPSLVGWRVTFTPEELKEFWTYMLERKVILDAAIETEMPPDPFTANKEWECGNCRYASRCQLLVIAKEEGEEVKWI